MSPHAPHDDPREALAEAIVFAHESDPRAIETPTGVTTAERAALEHTAALASAACASNEPLPPRLQQSLAAAALSYCAERSTLAANAAPRIAAGPTSGPGFVTSLARRPWRHWTSGAVTGVAAAAAALWFAFVLPTRQQCELTQSQLVSTSAELRASQDTLASRTAELATRTSELANRTTELANRDQRLAAQAAELAALRPSEAELRARRAAVLANDHHAFHRTWKPGPGSRDAHFSGDVVWSPERQDGWLSFRGLPKLDADHAYQLWIVDQRRDGPPVDGGLFLIENPDAETLVPIHAHLRVEHPVAFVITIEPKDGVVVSKQEHVVAIADS